MKPPFSISINITEAMQCHNAVSQLLRVFPSLSLTIAANETIPASSCPSQTDSTDAHIRAYVAACICSIYPRADPSRFRDAIDKAHANFGRLDSDSDAERTRTEAHISAASASRTTSEHAADETLRKAVSSAVKALDRGDDNADADDNSRRWGDDAV